MGPHSHTRREKGEHPRASQERTGRQGVERNRIEISFTMSPCQAVVALRRRFLRAKPVCRIHAIRANSTGDGGHSWDDTEEQGKDASRSPLTVKNKGKYRK